MSKRHIIVGNWKMHFETADSAKAFATALRRKSALFTNVDVQLAPPFTLLTTVAAALKNSSVKMGAQSVSQFKDEKRTGDVSATMAKAAGATFTLVGHSERRAMGETNTVVRAQLERALGTGLTAILCIGESERDQAGAYLSTITEQLSTALDGLAQPKPGKLIVAYEPVWAIGKSAQDAMSGADLREMSIFIKKTLTQHLERAAALKIPILYGGAVEVSNARKLIVDGDVTGLLVGHASDEIDSFLGIVKAVSKK
jgi:triosephosphate isomerase